MFLSSEITDEKNQYWVDYLSQHYDYCYLKNMHYINEHREINTIITGLSYGLNGVEATEMDAAINFSMHSQDLFYDFLHVKRAVQNGKGKIRKCYITMGYYSLFYDMSLSNNKYKCYSIQGPLFGTFHHAEAPKILFDMKPDHLCEIFAREFFLQHPSYYGVAVTREQRCPLYSSYPNGWQEMTMEQRDKTAHAIALRHNKFGKYKETLMENINILVNYINFLFQNNITPIILYLPFSEEYRKYIMKEYKEITLKILNKMPYHIEYLDLNETDIFETQDFLDADHLNQKGAIKATNLLKVNSR